MASIWTRKLCGVYYEDLCGDICGSLSNVYTNRGNTFLVDIALGITARTVPQLNIFVVGFPIKIGVSFLVLLVMMGVLMAVVQKMFEMMVVSMRDLMIILGGG